MKAELKGFHSPDIFDLQKFNPLEKDNFCFYLEFSAGPKNDKGSEQFGITLCTPKWLLDNKNENDIIFGRHYLIVFDYSYKRIYNFFKEYIENLEENDWDSLAQKIGRIAYWEFEDYH